MGDTIESSDVWGFRVEASVVCGTTAGVRIPAVSLGQFDRDRRVHTVMFCVKRQAGRAANRQQRDVT